MLLTFQLSNVREFRDQQIHLRVSTFLTFQNMMHQSSMKKIQIRMWSDVLMKDPTAYTHVSV